MKNTLILLSLSVSLLCLTACNSSKESNALFGGVDIISKQTERPKDKKNTTEKDVEIIQPEKTENAENNKESQNDETEKPKSEKKSENESENESKSETKTSANVLNDMSDSQRKEVNTFLSNFSEAHYKKNYSDSNEDKINFVYKHVMINTSGDEIIYGNGITKISESTVDRILNRFFGESIPHKTPSNATTWEYSDGFFQMPSADGESVAYFSVATNMIDNGNNSYTIDFKVYFNENGPHDPIPKECYTYTAEKAGKNYSYVYSGTATVKPKTVNGSETYEIISYSIF